MRRKIAYSLALLSILLVLSAVTTNSLAADYKKVGVQVGSAADYTFTIGKHVASNTTGTMHLSITAITNVTLVSFNYTYSYQNGTTHSSAQTGNVSTGFYGGNITVLQLIAANLTVNDNVAIGNSWKINQTAYMIVAGANRTLNHFYFASGVVSIYYDRITGMMTDIRLNFGPLLGWINMTMTSTNLWSATGGGGLSTTTLIIIGGVALVVIVAALLLLRRRK